MATGAKTGGTWSAFSTELADSAERVSASVVAIDARERIPSSGVHWRDGVVVTANHTIRRDHEITVSLADGAPVPATLVGRDPTTDLAVLRLGPASEASGSTGRAARAASTGVRSTVPVPRPGTAGPLRAGDLVLGVGRPGREIAVSVGIVRAVGGEWRTWRGGKIDQLIRLDMAVLDGFSGGALIEATGTVVGVTTSGLARGAALAVPGTTVNRVVDQLLATGRIPRGYLGVGVQPVRLPDAIAARLKLSERSGAMVMLVEPGSPAEQGGLLMGDVLVDIDGTPAGHTGDLLALLGAEQIEKRVTARVIRAGAIRELQLTVGEKPPRPA